MNVEPTGVVFYDTCQIQTDKCVGAEGNFITAVLVPPSMEQVSVCRSCLNEMVRGGQWSISGAWVDRMVKHWDIRVYSPENELSIVVDVKNKTEIDRRFLSRYHEGTQNAFDDSPAACLLLITPHQIFRWNKDSEVVNNPLSFIESNADSIIRYAESCDINFEELKVNDPQDFRFKRHDVMKKHFHFTQLVKNWLADIVDPESLRSAEYPPSILDRELLSKIHGGKVVGDEKFMGNDR